VSVLSGLGRMEWGKALGRTEWQNVCFASEGYSSIRLADDRRMSKRMEDGGIGEQTLVEYGVWSQSVQSTRGCMYEL
jgi:hypothetical protein